MENPEVIETPEVQPVEVQNQVVDTNTPSESVVIEEPEITSIEDSLEELNDFNVAVENLRIAIEELNEEVDNDIQDVQRLSQASNIINEVTSEDEYTPEVVANIKNALEPETLDADNENITATESFKDWKIAKEAINEQLTKSIQKAEQSSASFISRVFDRVGELFKSFSRFDTRINKARDDLKHLTLQVKDKKINLSFKGKRFSTIKSGALGGEAFFKKYDDNLNFVADITDIIIKSSEFITEQEIGWKEFFTGDKYREIFLQGFEETFDIFFDKLVSKGKITNKVSGRNKETAINNDLLGGKIFSVTFPKDSLLPKKGDHSEEAFKMAKASIYKFGSRLVSKNTFGEKNVEFLNITTKNLADMIEDSERTLKYVSGCKATLNAIQKRAAWQARKNLILSPNTVAVIASELFIHFTATLKMRKHFCNILGSLAYSLLSYQMELLTTSVIVAERSANPKYWK